MSDEPDNFSHVKQRIEAISAALDTKMSTSSLVPFVIVIYGTMLAGWVIWMVFT